jgi:hypothetical protein
LGSKRRKKTYKREEGGSSTDSSEGGTSEGFGQNDGVSEGFGGSDGFAEGGSQGLIDEERLRTTSGLTDDSDNDTSSGSSLGRRSGLTNGTGQANGFTNGRTNSIGRTNGLTNGTGRTNGRGRTNGLTNGTERGKTNGLTNGTGRTNGRGRTNGLTNGRGRTNGFGRTNGMTNGQGRTNGLTNGLGRTNGLTNGLTNGRGRTNGLTNGLGRTNGLTNGLGRTNGLTNGLTNGRGRSDFQPRRMAKKGAMAPRKLSFILILAFLIMMPVTFGLLLPGVVSVQAVQVDGKFKEWGKMTHYVDTAMYTDPVLDISEFAIAVDKTDFFAYVQTQGNLLSRATIDRYFVFIDADGSAATGYAAVGLGAEYVVEAYGYNEGDWTVTALKFFGADQQNWSAFGNIGSGRAVSKDSQMELKASLDLGTGNELDVGGAARFRLASMTGSAMADICAPIVDGEHGALVITQAAQDDAGIVTGSLLNVQLRAVGKDVTVNSLAISPAGLTATVQTGFTAGILAANTAMTVQVAGDVAALANGALVKAGVSSAEVMDATFNVNGNSLAAYAKVAPSSIAIDGAFADWNGVQKTTDAAGDVTNANIDIIDGAAEVQSGGFFAYVKFNGAGNAMAGMAVPMARAVPTGGGGGTGNGSAGPTILPRVGGEDIARFYIDSVAGGSAIGGIQADFVIELRGKNGVVNEKRVLTYPGRIQIGTAVAEAGAGAIEASVTLLQIGNPTGTVRMFVETTDWERKADSAAQTTTVIAQSSTRGILDPNWGGATTNKAVCTSSFWQYEPQLIPDGQGGAIIVWHDYRSGSNYDIYAQRINSAGTAMWTTNGVAICTYSDSQFYPQIVPDGQGGAIITWLDNRMGTQYNIYAQRVDSTGTVKWATDGVAICTQTNKQYAPQMTVDGQGGAIITWVDERNAATWLDIYAQRVTAAGTRPTGWAVDGNEICRYAGDQGSVQNYDSPQIVPDGQGGAIIAWRDARVGDNGIYAQKVASDGTLPWATAGGIAICTKSGTYSSYELRLQMTTDEQGGAIIAWGDYRSGSGYDIYAQRIKSDTTLWTTAAVGGIAVCTANYNQAGAQLVPDGQGGAIITWGDSRNSGTTGNDIYAQRMSSAGVVQWVANGVALCTAVRDQYFPQLVPDGQGGAIITWYDYRSNADYDIYAQRVNTNGVSLWLRNGLAVCTRGGDQEFPQITIDSRWLSGNQQMQSPEQSNTANEMKGIIIVWQDKRTGSNADIYAQAINEDGKEFKETHGLDPKWGDAATNTAICVAPDTLDSQSIIPDGQGGAFIAWYDYRNAAKTSFDIYVQRINAAGAVQWTANGVCVCNEPQSQGSPMLVSDGQGGVLIAWADYRNAAISAFDIYVQRLNSAGTAQWTPAGVLVCNAAGSQDLPQLVPDGQGGAIMVWYDYRTGTSDLYAQRVDGAGTMLWTSNGVAVCTQANDQRDHQIAQDGQGGAIIVWRDQRVGTTTSDIYVQRVSSAGAMLWTADGVPVCTSSDYQNQPCIVQDGLGGAIMAWADNRNSGTTGYDIYAQRVNSTGAVQWIGNGVAVCTALKDQFSLHSIPDGDGGAILSWQDYRGTTYDIYAQRVGPSGGLGWASNGVAVCVDPGYQNNVRLVPDGSGGAIAFCSGNNDIYGQRLTAGTGARLWGANGMVICSAASSQIAPTACIDGQGGAIVVWRDNRNGNVDLYAQRISLTQSTIEINEVMFDQASAVDWVELYNPSTISYDITGWTLKDGAGTIYTFPSLTLAANAYTVATVSGLDATDDVTLTDIDGAIRDFVAWGTSAPSDSNYNAAVASQNWPAGTFVSTTGFVAGNTIARDRSSNDTNAPGDWDITSGVDAISPTPIKVNDTPEFPTVAIPIIFCALPFIIFRVKKRKH